MVSDATGNGARRPPRRSRWAANWGYFTLLAAHLASESGSVLALEPDPRLFQALWDNIRRNDLGQVAALELAAADQAGAIISRGYDACDDALTSIFRVNAAPVD